MLIGLKVCAGAPTNVSMDVAGRRVSGFVGTSVLVPLAVAVAALAAFYAGLSGSTCFDVAWTASAASALAGMLAARSRAPAGNRGRYTLWSLAAGSWLFGQLAWDVFGVVGFPPSPSIADAGWWGFAVLVIASIVAPPRRQRGLKAVAALETAPMLMAAVALCLAWLWPAITRSQLALGPKLSAVAYPVLYVPAAVLALHAIVGRARRREHSLAMGVVLGGLTAQAIAFSLWSEQLLAGTYVPGRTLLDPLWVVGLGAVGIGGLLSARAPEQVASLADPAPSGALLPAGMFLTLGGAVVTAQLLGADAAVTTILAIGLLCCGLALLGRAMLLGRRLSLLLDSERAALARLAEREADLARLNAQLVEDSRRDPLTGIGNRRALADDIPMYESLQRDAGERIAIALCDVDHFKPYNDRLGHLAGDQALRMIAATARGALRASDTAYRFGGEELLLVLRDITDAEALEVAERVRRAVEAAAFAHPETHAAVLTVSIGLAAGAEPVGSLLARADGALYQAKHAGRNRVVVAGTYSPVPVADPGAHGGEDGDRIAEADPAADMPRHVRGILAVSRAASTGETMQVIEALGQAIHGELSFQVVAINLLDPASGALRVVSVTGDRDASDTLLGTSWPVTEWERLLAAGEHVSGATWLPAGSYEWAPEEPVWTPPGVPSLSPGAWHPEDMLLLPLRGADGTLLGAISVDQPLVGRRPTHTEIGVLMAVADHAGLVLEHLQRTEVPAAGSDELRLAAVMLLAETHDLRDAATARHARTVGRLARLTAVQLGLPQSRVERIHAAGVVHDLGKLGICDAILQKPGALDESEWREIRRHPEIGARILDHAGMRDIAGWVRAHHERIDGCGYPAGLGGEQIPLEARILAVADAYEAMVAERPYRAALTSADARLELERCTGTQFDGAVVAALMRALERAGAERSDPAFQRAA